MLGSKYYWGTVKKAITAFGSLFTDIQVDRINEKTGKVEQTIKVPLLYSPRQKSIASIEATPESYEQEFQVIVPRMGFEVVNMTYDRTRRTPATNYTYHSERNNSSKIYTPSPYNIIINLGVYARNQEDGWQIIEQIVPFFTPDYNVNKNSMPELQLEEDIPITLLGINFEDLYSNAYTERRMIIWDLSFEMKLNFFGPVRKGSIIKRTNVNVIDSGTNANIADYKAEINPFDADKEDIFIIDEYWNENI